MASDENPPYVLIDEKGIETLLAKISSSGSNNSSIVATTQLPQFRGRRRRNDLAFVKTYVTEAAKSLQFAAKY